MGNRFYVEFEGNFVEREHSTRLHWLLTYTPPAGPVLTKKGTVAKRQPAPHKDSPGWFYCAQLLHYGLKPLKTKAPAKKQLLAAFDKDGVLRVPDNILQIERELKAEYQSAIDVAQKKYEEAQRKAQLEEEKKQQQAEERRKNLFDRVLAASSSLGIDEVESDDGDDEDRTMEALQDAVDTIPVGELRRMIKTLMVVDTEVEEAVREYVSQHNTKTKRKQKAQVGKGKGKSSNLKTKMVPDRELLGKFDIVAPYIAEQWGYTYGDAFVLKICPSSTRARLWGTFEFGVISGVIRSSAPTTKLPDRPFSAGLRLEFAWRGREGSGETTFDKSNTGYLIFLGDGLIKGKLRWEGYKFDLAGSRDQEHSGRVVWSKHLPKWKGEWRGYNRRNYDVECSSRWGGWGGERVTERPADSDTTDAGRGSGGGRYDSDEVMNNSGEEDYPSQWVDAL
ncbi:hypothetical protein PQX77_015874 [Marasmius sp. AFHP31]|nr:hypothetical protein PQX77_015874 [Marasmius sp. AFHP31]